MKKRIQRAYSTAFAVCLLLVACFLSGCTDKASQEEIINYVNVEQPKFLEVQNEMLSSYNSVIGDNYTNDLVTYEELETNTVPLLNDLQEKVNALEIKNEDLKEVHKIYIEYTRSFKNSVISLMSAIEDQDTSKTIDSNNYMYEAQDYAKDYDDKVMELCKKYNITFTKN